MNAGTRGWRVLALAGYFVLLILVIAACTRLAPPERVPVSVALLTAAGPLLLPLRGLLHGRPYTHAWTSFLALPYFVLGIDSLAAGTAPTWLGWATIAASLALFAGAVGYARARGRELRAAAESD